MVSTEDFHKYYPLMLREGETTDWGPATTYKVHQQSLQSTQVNESPHEETKRRQKQIQLHFLRTCRHQLRMLTSLAGNGATEALCFQHKNNATKF